MTFIVLHKNKDVKYVLIISSLNLHKKRRGDWPCACKHSRTSLKKKVLEAFFNIMLYCKQADKMPRYVLKKSKNAIL